MEPLWNTKIVLYMILLPLFSILAQKEVNKIKEAIKEWSEFTCIKFVQARGNEEYFIKFVDGSG